MITAIIASPRKDGYGTVLTDAVVGSARAAGKEVSIHRLNDMRTFRQCQNCEAYKKNGGECILKDDISPIIDEIRDAEGIILCTSINFNDADGLFKLFLDRFYCFLDQNATTIMPKGKKVAVIVTAGADADGAERVSDELEKIMVQHFFCESVGRMSYCTWMMPLDVPIDEEALEKAREIGARFA